MSTADMALTEATKEKSAGSSARPHCPEGKHSCSPQRVAGGSALSLLPLGDGSASAPPAAAPPAAEIAAPELRPAVTPELSAGFQKHAAPISESGTDRLGGQRRFQATLNDSAKDRMMEHWVRQRTKQQNCSRALPDACVGCAAAVYAARIKRADCCFDCRE